jgi:hypothetical protein
MPKKSHVKKQKYKASCLAQVRKGYINKEDGTWVLANQIGPKSMVRDMQAGYHLNRR